MDIEKILRAIENKDVETAKLEIIHNEDFKSSFHKIATDFALDDLTLLVDATSYMFFQGMLKAFEEIAKIKEGKENNGEMI